MDLKTGITIAQIIIAVLVVVTILLQNRGEGLGSFFGGGGEIFRTRRGVENLMYYVSLGLSALLVVLSIVNTSLS
ncbi:MAG: preprotein translocase subunit SecG [Candidatus Dojkabacteria bacterium]|nr:preprotein translocase subunit SecG [Candidatus Dojkabacteria bacterium]